jgi:hypothetical protein
VKGATTTTALYTCRKECNKCDLTAAHCFSDLPIIITIGPVGLLLAVHYLFYLFFAVHVSVVWVGLQTAYYNLNFFGCRKYFLQGHILSTVGDALTQSKH